MVLAGFSLSYSGESCSRYRHKKAGHMPGFGWVAAGQRRQQAWRQAASLPSVPCNTPAGNDTVLHQPRHGGKHRYHDRVAELPVCLGVRHRNAECRFSRRVIAHQACALARRQPARTVLHVFLMVQPECMVKSAVNQDFRPVLVVTGGQRAGSVGMTDQTIAKAVALFLVLEGIVEQVFPQLGRQRVQRIHFRCP
jgi:hypothetical protein